MLTYSIKLILIIDFEPNLAHLISPSVASRPMPDSEALGSVFGVQKSDSEAPRPHAMAQS